MASRSTLKAWAAETDLGRRLFNHNFRLSETAVGDWSLVKSVTPHADDQLSEAIYIWQDPANPERLIRVDIAELADWKKAQDYLARTFEQTMRPHLPRAGGNLKNIGDIQFLASSPDADHAETIRFARGNITVLVSSVGGESVDVTKVAQLVDRELSDLRSPSKADTGINQAIRSRRATTLALPLDPEDRSWTKAVAEGGELSRQGSAIVLKPSKAAQGSETAIYVDRATDESGTSATSLGSELPTRSATAHGLPADERTHGTGLLELTAEIVTAHVSHNQVAEAELPRLIAAVHSALAGLNSGATELPPERQEPAVSVRASVRPDYLVCLEDGKKMRMLKRHLLRDHGMTPDEYRQKWGLPRDYPLIAPNYAEQRRALAKAIGLGRTPKARRGSSR